MVVISRCHPFTVVVGVLMGSFRFPRKRTKVGRDSGCVSWVVVQNSKFYVGCSEVKRGTYDVYGVIRFHGCKK